MSTTTLTRPWVPGLPATDEVLTAPDGSTKYRASQLKPCAAEVAEWCNPTQSGPAPNELAIEPLVAA